MVVPWNMRATSSGLTPLVARISATPVMNPTDGSLGVDGVLCTHWALDAVSQRTMSVKVPPTSTATEYEGMVRSPPAYLANRAAIRSPTI